MSLRDTNILYNQYTYFVSWSSVVENDTVVGTGSESLLRVFQNLVGTVFESVVATVVEFVVDTAI